MARKSGDAEKHTETSQEVKDKLKGLKAPVAGHTKPTGVPGLPTSGTTGTRAAAEACASRAASKAK